MDNKKFEKDIVSLVRSAVTGTPAVVSEEFDAEAAFAFAKKQSLVPLVYYGLENSQIELSEEVSAKLDNAVLSHFVVDQQQQAAVAKLQDEFEENGIDYMPIKGVLLRHLYPKTEMRPMGDADIMIRVEQRDSVVKVMEDNGYKFSHETEHELVYKKGKVLIELHKCLIPSRTKDFYEYYKDCWSFAKPDENSRHRYNMSDEDHLVFLLTHFAKHYRAGGVGVLHMADFYLYLKNKCVDNAYVRRELEKLSLLEFYDNVVSTVECWFNGGPNSDITEFITHRVFSNGLWGTVETRDLAIASRTTQVKYKIRQVFPKPGAMKYRYPVLKKHPYLLPVMWVVRWGDLLFFRRDHLKKKMASLENTNKDNVSAYQRELNYVGLNFNYEE